MKIRQVVISEEAEDKILEHGVAFSAVESVFYDDPLFVKAKYGRYMAIGLDEASNWLTVIFEYRKGCAEIVTAYPSSEWQVKLYKRKKKRGKK